MYGLQNWQPKFIDTTDEVLALCRRVYSEIVGYELECSWVAWLQNDDKWWEGAPVILRINGANYEFCWSKDSEFALTLNSINVHEPVRWCDCEELTFFWKKDALPILQKLVKQKIAKLQLREAQVTITNHSDGVFNSQYWLPNGINFSFSNGYLCVYNAFDINGLTNESEEQEGIRLIEI